MVGKKDSKARFGSGDFSCASTLALGWQSPPLLAKSVG